MKKIIVFLSLSLLFLPSFAAKKILKADYSGIISPVSAEYLGQAVEKANNGDYSTLIIALDTPGGLDLSMRSIVKDILGSKIPVILYVSPSGARSASAGVFIAMASHIIAMSPGTNMGSAHPVMIGGASPIAPASDDKKDKKGKDTMEEKVLNDSVAYIKSIAQHRKRNADWAVKAVEKSISISSEDALKQGIIDIVAKDTGDLLAQLSKRRIQGFGKINFAGAEIENFNYSVRQKILAVITDPNVAMILMSIGAAGLLIELYNPGLIFPGIVGALSIIVAFYSFQTLSANASGIALLILGLIFLIIEIKVTSYGLLTLGAVISIILGGLMLFSNTASMGVSVSMDFLYGLTAGLVILTAILTYIVAKAHKRKVATGLEGFIGKTGKTMTVLNPGGKIIAEGELWDAVSLSGDIAEGQEIKIVKIDGFKVLVEKI